MEAALTCAASYVAFGALHELCHVLAGALLGCSPDWTIDNCASLLFGRHVCIPSASRGLRKIFVQHSGWIGSMMLLVWVLQARLRCAIVVSATLTFLEALVSDLLMLQRPSGHAGLFFCGNFGMVLINSAWNTGSRAKDLFEQMVQITMMRGAQSGGVVTYVQASRCQDNNLRGARVRVVGSRRSDLSKRVRSKLARMEKWASISNGLYRGVRLYAGHTRYSPTSMASSDDTHPQQWSPPSSHDVFVGFGDGVLKRARRNVENFICHIGELDSFQVGERKYDLGSIQEWLLRATGYPMPSSADSCAVSGLIDVLRTQGSWFHSIRFGFLFGLPRKSLDYAMPKRSDFQKVANVCQAAFSKFYDRKGTSLESLMGCTEELSKEIQGLPKGSTSTTLGLSDQDFATCLDAAISAFFNNDLLSAVRLFMSNARGSFGMCVTSSLDSDRQMVLAARGQTTSIAFYPKTGLILYGSEQAAVKAAVGVALSPESARESPESNPAVRLDLEDLGGEICLLDWSGVKSSASKPDSRMAVQSMMGGNVTMTLVQESLISFGRVADRLIPLEDNPLVLPLPRTVRDPVARDIADIPRVLSNIIDDWNSGNSLNRLTAWTLGRQLKARLNKKAEGLIAADSVDILITGCEVSLWVAEQFASDLSLACKNLIVRTAASNKVLGLLGEKFKMPQLGHPFSERAWDLTDSIVLIVSHSGGTFPSLGASNLLQAVTQNIFAVTSEWDTQIGRQLRQMSGIGSFQSRVFSTEVGVRPAEPCSISVAATHQLLTQIFEYILMVIACDETLRTVAGSTVKSNDLSELERCNQDNINALEEIVGVDRHGQPLRNSTTEKELRDKGAIWANHVLENPRSWIMCAVYVVGTVTAGHTVITFLALSAGLEDGSRYLYLTRFFDAIIYLFLPQLFILLIRLVQRRRLLHRMVGRSVVIGDCPWVSQCVDAFLSKLFACSYSAAGVTVFSGNPADHLAHRMTHRVVRGCLLAVGRPDGRLAALSSLESAVSLTVNQASSIQSIGSTCESLTIGHNPYKLPLTEHAIFLKGKRPDYICERLLREASRTEIDDEGLAFTKSIPSKSSAEAFDDLPALKPMSSGSLLGEYSNLSGGNDDSCETPLEKLQRLVDARIKEKEQKKRMQKVFDEIDTERSGEISFDDFSEVCKDLGKDSPIENLPVADLRRLFRIADTDRSGGLTIDECKDIIAMDYVHLLQQLGVPSEEAHPMQSVTSSKETYFGEALRRSAPRGTPDFEIVKAQELSMQLYESRIASLQRAVAFFVLFHELGKRVACFWPRVSFGRLGYRMDRSHCLIRVATTACPVSGSDVRVMMRKLASAKQWKEIIKQMNFAQTEWLNKHIAAWPTVRPVIPKSLFGWKGNRMVNDVGPGTDVIKGVTHKLLLN